MVALAGAAWCMLTTFEFAAFLYLGNHQQRRGRKPAASDEPDFD